MRNKEKPSKKLIILMIIILIISIIVWGIVLGLYYQNKYSTNVENRKSLESEASSRNSHENNRMEFERVTVYKNNSGPVIRFVYEALIEEEVSKDDLIKVSEVIVNEMVEERRGFQALAIHYYTHRELMEYPPALGTVVYAPNGKWDNAGEGRSDFSNFMIDTKGLVKKDWNLKPSETEVKMFKVYSEHEYVDDGIKEVSKKHDVTPEEARERINKVNNWIYK